MILHRFTKAHLPATPWKNGGGVTREIVASPAGSDLDTFAWRVSIADVSADGPFSVFQGVDRVLVLLEGNGVALHDAEGRMLRRLDQPFVPFAFRGGERITSSLLAGPGVDFNVMTRRGFANADVRVLRTRQALESYEAGVLFAARGRWIIHVADNNALRLEGSDGCWWDDEPVRRRRWHVEPDSPEAVLLVAGIHLASTG